MILFSQVTYYGGYSGEDPPLPIPNREVKLTIADGTDPPVGRVGSRRSSSPRSSDDSRGLFLRAAQKSRIPSSAVPSPRISLPPRLPGEAAGPPPVPSRYALRCLYGSIYWTFASKIGHYCMYGSIKWTCTSTFNTSASEWSFPMCLTEGG